MQETKFAKLLNDRKTGFFLFLFTALLNQVVPL